MTISGSGGFSLLLTLLCRRDPRLVCRDSRLTSRTTGGGARGSLIGDDVDDFCLVDCERDL